MRIARPVADHDREGVDLQLLSPFLAPKRRYDGLYFLIQLCKELFLLITAERWFDGGVEAPPVAGRINVYYAYSTSRGCWLTMANKSSLLNLGRTISCQSLLDRDRSHGQIDRTHLSRDATSPLLGLTRV